MVRVVTVSFRLPLDILYARVDTLVMNNNEATWTDKQRAAFEALKASFERNDAKRLNAPSLMNKAPKGGWTEADKVAK